MRNVLNYSVLQGALIILLLSLPMACQNGSRLAEQNIVLNTSSFDLADIDLDQIKARGQLTAILNNSSTSYFIYRGQPMGYEYELLTRLAESLDVRLTIEVTNNPEEAYQMLERGEADLIAFNMTVTTSRRKRVSFTEHHHEVRQVLVQQKPEQWHRMKRHRVEDMLVRSALELEEKRIHVPRHSAYVGRLANLAEEIGGTIEIVEEDLSTEALIKMVAEGEIDYTVADENVARVNANYYPSVDIRTPVSLVQRVAWATRPNAPELLTAVNDWIHNIKSSADYNMIYRKYFHSPKTMLRRVRSDYSSVGGESISPYDDLLRQYAVTLGWDWRFLAAQIYQESKFDAEAKSWAGAEGLMQLLPSTGEMYGVTNMLSPTQSLRAGTAYLLWLDKLWTKYVDDPEERRKFVLASYNAGQGHVLDARRLADKYGQDPTQWKDVARFLLRLSEPAYYGDPVVRSGYCRGSEPIKYVREILQRYDSYRHLVDEGMMMASAAEGVNNG